MKCWEKTGCADLVLNGQCPHKLAKNCPLDCYYACRCHNPQHVRTSVMESFDHPEIDFDACQKEICRTCKFYLEHGPKLSNSK
ncbi:MAG: hypothetical protein MJ189_00815 [Coriobacteriales bacterium]|nr:hypothetical protein [Coriobacteriales bacterium]